MDTIEMLRARGRLSMARMYLVDLEKKADFGKMVDGRGNPFNCSKALWIERILHIANESMPRIPQAVNLVLWRLHVACPERALTLLPLSTPVVWNSNELAALHATRLQVEAAREKVPA